MFSLQHAIDEIVLQLCDAPASKQPTLVAELAAYRAYQIVTRDGPYDGRPLQPIRDALIAGALARLKTIQPGGNPSSRS